jgi:hypothetical protein
MLKGLLLHGDRPVRPMVDVYEAAGAYSNGIEGLILQSYNLDTSTIKLLLYKDSYTYDPDHDFVNDISTTHEADATGYTGGFAGADRLTSAVTITEQTASNRVVAIFADTTWTGIGGASNNTLEGALALFEITNDAASLPIANLEFASPLTTNGSDILVDMDGTNGQIRFTV